MLGVAAAGGAYGAELLYRLARLMESWLKRPCNAASMRMCNGQTFFPWLVLACLPIPV